MRPDTNDSDWGAVFRYYIGRRLAELKMAPSDLYGRMGEHAPELISAFGSDSVLGNKYFAMAANILGCSPIEFEGCLSEVIARFPDMRITAYFQAQRRAQTASRSAVAAGLIKKSETCEICGAGGRIESHHDSYDRDRWLVVVWMCKRCHVRIPSQLKRLR
jgi:ribosomal protein S27AE